MLKRLHLRNFTVFADAEFVFGEGLNVIAGTNGTGKSHVLKLGYAVSRSSNRLGRDLIAKRALAFSTGASSAITHSITPSPTKSDWQKVLADDLKETFRPDSLGRLTRRAQGRSRTEIEVSFVHSRKASIDCSFSANSKSEVVLEGETPSSYVVAAPVFIPTKELLSLFPGLRELYDKFHLALDITYPDLCDRLSVPLLRGPKSAQVTAQLAALETLLGGSVRNENGRFYLYQREGGRLEIDLVAEGIRKLATVAFLLNNGSLNEQTTLFWDEPDANLNPQLLKYLAQLLLQLAGQGFQIIIATHSLFLLKEFHILSKQLTQPVRYFGLSAQPGEAVTVATADNLELLPDIVALDAELEQTDRFQRVLDREDANGN